MNAERQGLKIRDTARAIAARSGQVRCRWSRFGPCGRAFRPDALVPDHRDRTGKRRA
ncbi:hypothetical protein GLE_1007 [Lysobacter enzymogenes]|uniref:Uncharacterized protein n=1 Tax=Lysobacter enzymogenes TaxID=69 RepID=A0A0S2DDA5_LYSEN|nr:hypothetical protein GLE_1007 [Lysobacter enzymogenes]